MEDGTPFGADAQISPSEFLNSCSMPFGADSICFSIIGYQSIHII